jgi:hypothetical protein
MENFCSEGLGENFITAENKKDKFDIGKFWRLEDPSLSDIINGRDCEELTKNIRRSQIKCIIKKWTV